jgi:hypothetical protein
MPMLQRARRLRIATWCDFTGTILQLIWEAALIDSLFLINRVLHELRVNSLRAEHVGSQEGYSDYRATWCSRPRSGVSRLFHRWLWFTDASRARKYSCREHLNDIPLDCRVLGPPRVENNRYAHLLSRSLRLGNVDVHVETILKHRRGYELGLTFPTSHLPFPYSPQNLALFPT